MKSGAKRFQTQSIKDGPIAFQDDDNKYYLESDGKGVAELPPQSVALSEKTASGKPQFQLKYVVKGPVYYQGKDGKYHLDAPVLKFPQFNPAAITSTKVQLGHGSHGSGRRGCDCRDC